MRHFIAQFTVETNSDSSSENMLLEVESDYFDCFSSGMFSVGTIGCSAERTHAGITDSTSA